MTPPEAESCESYLAPRRIQIPPNCRPSSTTVSFAAMKAEDDLPARLDGLIEDQERLLETIRKEKTGLVRVDRNAADKPSTPSSRLARHE